MERGKTMSTVIRPETSKKSNYYISKHRFYELKHFCLQYDEWKEEQENLLGIHFRKSTQTPISKVNTTYDPTADYAIRLAELSEKITMVNKTCQDADPELCDYIFKAVTKGYPYTLLKTKYEIPCSRDYFYSRYRKFFYILSQIKHAP